MAAESDPFPNYTQLRRRAPGWVWDVTRVLSFAAVLFVIWLLVNSPKDGLKLWWGLLVPCLPLVWFVAPGLWRNLCPLAAVNQLPRRTKLTFARTAPGWWTEYAPVFGIIALLAAISSRPVLFNSSGLATATLIGGALALALVGGVVFKGKSGWCSSLCPMLPVQRLYGQTPFVTVPNSHCQPCVGCTKNCYDFNPRVAWLADLHEENEHWTAYRLFFSGAFPGIVFAYFSTPPGLSTWEIYARFILAIAVGVGSFYVLRTFVKVSLNTLTALYAASAISIFYWYASMVLAETLLNDRNHWSVWILRTLVLSLALIFVWRTWKKEEVFLQQEEAPTAVRFGGGDTLKAIKKAQTGLLEVTFQDGVRVVARLGQSLLTIIEGSDRKIESGCRMGVCGADPICVKAGMENLSPPTKDEQATLERLGLAASTRMACCAKIRGPVTIGLAPERAAVGEEPKLKGFTFDPAVKRVVVLGNGIAGVTAADHVRRRHPDCMIDIVAAEAHPLYNRMGITRLIYGRSAMVGLQLLPDAWYEQNRITMWLNTQAVAIDREKKSVELGTGEILKYDRLVLAMGSEAFVPPVEGYGIPGTFALRRAEDAFNIRKFVQLHRCKTAAVAGGGLLGLEAAYALSKFGLSVTVLERGNWLLRRQLDARAAQLLQSYLEGLGLRFLLNAWATRLEIDKGRLAYVFLNDGREVRAELLLVAAGILPSVELARKAGLNVAKGVVVDDHLRTSDAAIFAVGDVAEHRGVVLGLWPTGVEQAEAAAENVVGGDRAYKATVPTTMLKVLGADMLSCGRIEAQDGEDELIIHEDEGSKTYLKLLIRDGRLQGAILLGHAPAASAISSAVKDNQDVSAILGRLRAGDLDALTTTCESMS
jgi:NADPH-dependent 2,4-dienoyl-CoA reductase/sulfur reductase-like enzyme/ferredoxin